MARTGLYRCRTPSYDPAVQEIDLRQSPVADLLSRLLVHERNLFRFLLVERVVVSGALLTWIWTQNGDRTAVVATASFVVWESATSIAMWGRFALLKRRPVLILSIEQAACVAVFLTVGTWRGTFYYTLAGPTVFAAAFIGNRLALGYASLVSAVVTISIGGFHLDDGRGPPHHTTVQDWGGAPPLFFAAAILVSYIRRLLDQFADISRRKATAAEELAAEQARLEHADREARGLIGNEFHDSVQQMLDSLPLRLSALATMSETAHDQRALRDAAAIAARASGDVRTALEPYAAARRERTLPDNEGALLLAHIDQQEYGYFRAILIARALFVLIIGIFLIDARDRLVPATLMWLGLCVWVGVTSYLLWPQTAYTALRRRRWLLVAEEAVAVTLLLAATTPSGNGFWMMGATAPVAATAVGKIGDATLLTVVSAAATAGSWYVARAAGWQGFPNKSGMFAATAGFAGLVLPAIYVRFLFDQLRAASHRVREDLEALQALRTQEAINRELLAAQPAIVDEVKHVVAALRAQLAEVGANHDDLVITHAQVVELERAVLEVGRLIDRSPLRHEVTTWSLDRTMEEAVSRLRATGGRAQILRSHDGDSALPIEAARPIARALGEALANAWKHAGPPIEISVERERRRVTFLVRDHGRGFVVQQAHAEGKLWRLRDYAREAGASVQLTSDETGTTVRMVFDAN